MKARTQFAVSKNVVVLLALFLLLAGSHSFMALAQNTPSAKPEFEFKTAWVEINGKQFKVELADNWDLRAQGLQFRSELCEDCGMLFQFERTRLIAMWMKNTLIPLDVAFFEQGGKIIDIKQMKPLDLTSVPSSAPVLYALEMNDGWFAKNGVKEGDNISVFFSQPDM